MYSTSQVHIEKIKLKLQVYTMVYLMVCNNIVGSKETDSQTVSIFMHLSNKTQAQEFIPLLVEVHYWVKASPHKKMTNAIIKFWIKLWKPYGFEGEFRFLNISCRCLFSLAWLLELAEVSLRWGVMRPSLLFPLCFITYRGMHRKITVGGKFNLMIKLFSKGKLICFLFSFSDDCFATLHGSQQKKRLITDVLLPISGPTHFSPQRRLIPMGISMSFPLFEV